MSRSDLSVILPIYLINEYLTKLTYACIENFRFFTQSYNIELIIIHNKYDKRSEISNPPHFLKGDTYIKHKGNIPLPRCYNKTIPMAKSEYVCLLSNDVLVHEDWFKYGKGILDNDESTMFKPWMNRNVESFKVEKKEIEDTGIYPTVTFPYFGGAACTVLRKSHFKKIGPFNEDVGFTWDVD